MERQDAIANSQFFADEEMECESQPSSDVSDVVPTEAEKDQFFRKRQRETIVPPVLAHRPDLAEFFDIFKTSNLERVKMCRAYASYLVSMEPVRDRAPYKKKK